MKTILFPIFCLLALGSTTSRLDGIIQENMEHYYAEFPEAKFESVCSDGYFDKEFSISYYNRVVADMICIDDWINPTCHVDYKFGHPNLRTLQHLMQGAWKDDFSFLDSENTIKKMKNYYENSDVHEFMYMDKYLGGIPWQVALMQEMLESGYKTSGLASQANNRFGIKCFSHSTATHLKWANAADGKARLAITAQGDTTCIWVGKDDHHHDHFKYFSSSLEGRQAHQKIFDKERYASIRNRPFNYEMTEFTVKIPSGKKVFYYGQKLVHGDKLWITNADAWFISLSALGYATDPRYADKIARRYFNLFKDWDMEKFIQEEDYYLGSHYNLPQHMPEKLASL